MKHFWLSAGQQTLMDEAVTTAGGYTHIAALKLGKSWKKELHGQSGFKVADDAYLRTYNVTRDIGLRFDSLVRLKPGQAMTMKLRYAGTNDGVVRPDPTGEFWGNMLIAQHDQRACNYLTGFRRRGYWPLAHFLGGDGFGPTLATVANHCAGLPISWATRLVWQQCASWHHAGDAVVRECEVPEQYRAAFDELFEQPEVTFGQSWARQWWARLQSPEFRSAMHIPDVPGEDIL